MHLPITAVLLTITQKPPVCRLLFPPAQSSCTPTLSRFIAMLLQNQTSNWNQQQPSNSLLQGRSLAQTSSCHFKFTILEQVLNTFSYSSLSWETFFFFNTLNNFTVQLKQRKVFGAVYSSLVLTNSASGWCRQTDIALFNIVPASMKQTSELSPILHTNNKKIFYIFSNVLQTHPF